MPRKSKEKEKEESSADESDDIDDFSSENISPEDIPSKDDSTQIQIKPILQPHQPPKKKTKNPPKVVFYINET